jgi:hypothetical protein
MAIVPGENLSALFAEVNGKLDWQNLSPKFVEELKELIKQIAEETP